MSRREERRKDRQLEAGIKAVVGLFLLVALGIGGVAHFVPVLITLVSWVLGLALLGGLVYLSYRFYRGRGVRTHLHTAPPRSNPAPFASTVQQPAAAPSQPVHSPAPTSWSQQKIETALGEIDWFQFEKFCAALLRTEGYAVERKGGAQPDGGVDLIASKPGETMLVQCKHWKTWTVQEKVIRELLGSMTHYGAKQGALHVLKGATRPAEAFARHHNITVVDGQELARRAHGRLTSSDLTTLLNSHEHHCPKCESVMVWRTGDFTPFWGCTNYPRCRGVLKHTGAR